jgi:hypothetical protein
VGSIPDEVNGFFNWQPHYGPGVDSSGSKGNEIQECSWVVKPGNRLSLTSTPALSQHSTKKAGVSTSHQSMGLHGVLQRWLYPAKKMLLSLWTPARRVLVFSLEPRFHFCHLIWISNEQVGVGKAQSIKERATSWTARVLFLAGSRHFSLSTAPTPAIGTYQFRVRSVFSVFTD